MRMPGARSIIIFAITGAGQVEGIRADKMCNRQTCRAAMTFPPCCCPHSPTSYWPKAFGVEPAPEKKGVLISVFGLVVRIRAPNVGDKRPILAKFGARHVLRLVHMEKKVSPDATLGRKD